MNTKQTAKTVFAASLVAGMLALAAGPAQAGDLKFGVYFGDADLHKVKSQRFQRGGFSKYFNGAAPSKHRHHRTHRQTDRYGEPICVSPYRIHNRMHRQGWYGFHALRVGPRNIHFKATRKNGLIYSLKVNRCSGILVRARLGWGQMFSGWLNGQRPDYR